MAGPEKGHKSFVKIQLGRSHQGSWLMVPPSIDGKVVTVKDILASCEKFNHALVP